VKDKRRHPRFQVEGIQGQMGLRAQVKLIDIGEGGAAIRTKKRLKVGDDCTLMFDLDGKSVTIEGVVVWVQPGEARPERPGPPSECTAGIRFTEAFTGELRALATFIDQRQVAEERRVTGMRFRLRNPRRAVLQSLEIYRVRLISLAGMLIETEGRLDLDEICPMEILPPGQEPIAFSGRVRSCLELREPAPARFEIGIEFLEMPPEFRDSLNRFLEWLATSRQ
jgi:hypothetical protein